MSEQLMSSVLFYLFSGLTLASAIAVISARSPVHSVLFLILSFFNAAALFLLLGAEMLAMLLVIVYVGAVAVLFLFVVMMLNINFSKMKEGLVKYLPIGFAVSAVLFAEIYMAIEAEIINLGGNPTQVASSDAKTNAHAIGQVLYTDYMLIFQASGMILLVAMIGAIVLTHRQREGVRKQKISDQNERKSGSTIKMIDAKSGEGV